MQKSKKRKKMSSEKRIERLELRKTETFLPLGTQVKFKVHGLSSIKGGKIATGSIVKFSTDPVRKSKYYQIKDEKSGAAFYKRVNKVTAITK